MEKHICVDYQYLIDIRKIGKVKVNYVLSEDMIAYSQTKGLSSERFKEYVAKIYMVGLKDVQGVGGYMGILLEGSQWHLRRIVNARSLQNNIRMYTRYSKLK